MSSEVKRYGVSGPDWEVGEEPDGEFALWTDYAALEAELERRKQLDQEALEFRQELIRQRDEARAELDAIKAQKPLAWLDLEKLRAGSMAYATTMQATARQSPIWALPPAGVEGLLKALDSIAFRAECFAEEERDMQPHSCEVVAGIARHAIAVWRQAQGLGGAVQKAATDTEPNRIPAGFYRELVALRELRDAIKLYAERYLQDEIESEESCVSPEQHDSACTVSDLLEKAFANHWNKTEAAGKAGSEACEK